MLSWALHEPRCLLSPQPLWDRSSPPLGQLCPCTWGPGLTSVPSQTVAQPRSWSVEKSARLSRAAPHPLPRGLIPEPCSQLVAPFLTHVHSMPPALNQDTDSCEISPRLRYQMSSKWRADARHRWQVAVKRGWGLTGSHAAPPGVPCDYRSYQAVLPQLLPPLGSGDTIFHPGPFCPGVVSGTSPSCRLP